MTMTDVFLWFFEALNGIGGWLILAGVALTAIVFVSTNSGSRRLPAIGWRWAAALSALLLLPGAAFNFLPVNWQETIAPYQEILFYAGLIGGILPAVIAIGYTLQFAGMAVCENGHLYARKLGECPTCIPEDFADYDPSELDETILDFEVGREESELDPFADDETVDELGQTDAGDATEAVEDDTEIAQRDFFETELGRVGLPPRTRPKANAFLVFSSGESCQLNQGSTPIGRSSKNDFVLQNTFISRNHAKIVEESRNLFRLYDLGSSNGTWLNGRKLMKSILLENDDVIRFGEEVTVVFLSSRKI